MRAAGVNVISAFALACDLMRDWRNTPGTPEMQAFFDTYATPLFFYMFFFVLVVIFESQLCCMVADYYMFSSGTSPSTATSLVPMLHPSKTAHSTHPLKKRLCF
jgi:hypothetical protein